VQQTQLQHLKNLLV